MENRELIENIVKKSPGFRGNEDLLEEMVNETIKKSSEFFDDSYDISTMEIYVKKIAMNAIISVLKNADKTREEKRQKGFQQVQISYETDSNGKIIYDVDLSSVENLNETKIEDEKIKTIKDKLIELNSKNTSKNYKQIFELRYVRGMNVCEISEKLEITEKEVSKNLLELFKELNPILN